MWKARKKKDEGNSVSLFMMGLEEEDKRRYLRQRVAFVVFSKLQLDYNLKLDTPFLAFEIFSRIDSHALCSDFRMVENHTVSIFLAMKYNEIYPPSLQ